MNQNTDFCDRIVSLLEEKFSSVNKPPRFFSSKPIVPIGAFEEFSRLEELDWENLKPESLKGLGEPVTFLEWDAVIYLAPRVFRLVCDYGQTAIEIDFVDTFFSLPIISDLSGAFDSLTPDQRVLLWNSYRILVEEYFQYEWPDWIEKRERVKGILLGENQDNISYLFNV